MRRIELLINEVREATDIDATKVSNTEIIGYYNYAQSEIQSIVFGINPKNNLFTKIDFISTVFQQPSYDLPDDTYADNAIRMVERYVNQGGAADRTKIDSYRPVTPITEEEKRALSGYYVQDKKLWLSPVPTYSQTDALRVTYFRRLPKLAVRAGTVSAATSGVSVTVTGGDADMVSKSDFFCIVDRDGTIIAQELRLDGYNSGTGVISTSSSFTGVSAGQYVVLGQYATTHSQLPEECETLLQDYVKGRMFTRQASDGEVLMQREFTKEQKATVANIFSDAQRDILCPPITDADYMRV